MTRRPLALAGLLALAATPARATFIVYTSQASYLAALASNPFKDTYNDLTLGSTVSPPLNRSGNGFSYLASATGGFFAAGTTTDVWLSTNNSTDSVGYKFSSNVRGAGGFFFADDTSGAFLAGVTVNISAVDGTQTLGLSLPNTTTSTFFGVISDGPITSFTIGVAQLPGQLTFVAANDFIIGATPTTTAVPAPPNLLLGLMGAGLAGLARRRRRPAAA